MIGNDSIPKRVLKMEIVVQKYNHQVADLYVVIVKFIKCHNQLYWIVLASWKNLEEYNCVQKVSDFISRDS